MFCNHQYYPNSKGNVVLYILIWYQMILFFSIISQIDISWELTCLIGQLLCLLSWDSHFVNDQTSLQKCLHRVMQNHTKAWAKVKWRYFCSKREKSGKGITFSGALILTFSGRKKKFSTENSFLHTSPLQSAKSKEPQVTLKIQFMFANITSLLSNMSQFEWAFKSYPFMLQ